MAVFVDELQAEPFFFAATKIRFGRGRSLSRQPLQASHSSLQRRRIESDAKHRCRNNCCRRNHSSLRLRRIESDAEHRCRNNCCRRNHSPLASIRKSELEIKNRCTQEGLNRQNHASILKSGLEIKNRCTQEEVNGENLASIPKSGPEIKNRCMQQAIFSTRSLDEPLWRYVGGNLRQR